jgi:phosphoadenosine phosphosulfate reductase
MPNQMTADEIAVANDQLTMALPQEVLHWAVGRFHPRILMATAFGAEGCCIIHMLAEIEPKTKVINLDTGYQFPETLELRERIKERYGMVVEFVRPELNVSEY